jgi:hypothetical protein
MTVEVEQNLFLLTKEIDISAVLVNQLERYCIFKVPPA